VYSLILRPSPIDLPRRVLLRRDHTSTEFGQLSEPGRDGYLYLTGGHLLDQRSPLSGPHLSRAFS
jgi:hypothetical protein